MNRVRIALLIAAIPPAFLILVQWRYAITIPYMDQWELVPYLDAWHSGTLSITELVAQHNAHRIAVPRAVMIGLASLTHWDIRFEIVLNFLLGASIFAAAITGLPQIRVNTMAILASSVLIFSIAQWRNWLWGWQMQIFMCCLFAMIAMVFAARRERHTLFALCAIPFAVVATFSFAAGLAIWPVGLAIFLHNRKDALPAILLWCVSGIVAAGLYLWGFEMPGDATPPAMTWTMPLQFVAYVFAFVGGSVAGFHPGASVFAGVAGLVVWMWLQSRTDSDDRSALSAGIVAFVVLSGCIAAAGRGGEGAAQAIASRYTTFSALFWVAVVHDAVARSAVSSVVRLRVVFVVLVGAAFMSAYGLYQGSQRANYYNAARDALNKGGDHEELDRLYPARDVLLERREVLKRERLSIFSDSR